MRDRTRETLLRRAGDNQEASALAFIKAVRCRDLGDYYASQGRAEDAAALRAEAGDHMQDHAAHYRVTVFFRAVAGLRERLAIIDERLGIIDDE